MRHKKVGRFNLLKVIIFVTIFMNLDIVGPFFGAFGGMFSLLFKFVFGLMIAGIVLLILKALGIGDKKEKKVNIKDDLIKALKKSDLNGNKIVLDEDTYLLLSDVKNIGLESIDIYMNDEYVGNLKEFSTLYPNAFNSLSDKLVKNLKKKKENTIIENIPVVKEIKKDCAYYIDKFNDLNEQIEVERVKSSIDETIDYLKQIKKIEDEFKDSKEKTRKLYEYYLPMYADILANYDRLHDNALESQEFKESEAKVIKTSSLINTALRNVVSSLTESYYTDLRVNMKTLESLLKKDGLVKDNLENQSE